MNCSTERWWPISIWIWPITSHISIWIWPSSPVLITERWWPAVLGLLASARRIKKERASFREKPHAHTQTPPGRGCCACATAAATGNVRREGAAVAPARGETATPRDAGLDATRRCRRAAISATPPDPDERRRIAVSHTEPGEY